MYLNKGLANEKAIVYKFRYDPATLIHTWNLKTSKLK